jgi:hypothetical protein
VNIERLKKIIEYSTVNREDIENKVEKFYSFTGISSNCKICFSKEGFFRSGDSFCG